MPGATAINGGPNPSHRAWNSARRGQDEAFAYAGLSAKNAGSQKKDAASAKMVRA
ncbi:MAG: hypothetical protein HY675_05535 [Chloroflexi bacterium]|nr:hypothetical protein [Chloroflexota bacterium]